MADDIREAAALIRGLKDRVAQLEERVSSAEGIPNLLRSIENQGSSEDGGVTVSTQDAGAMQYDNDTYDGGTRYQ